MVERACRGKRPRSIRWLIALYAALGWKPGRQPAPSARGWATGEGVADREGYESQKFLGYGERVEVWGGGWRSR